MAEADVAGRPAVTGGAPRLGFWPDRRAFPIRWWSSTILGATVLIWAGAYISTAVFTTAKSPWVVALGIATGTKDPFDAAPAARGVAAVLAVWSWLAVPIGIGTFVALFLQDKVKSGTAAIPPPPPSATDSSPAAGGAAEVGGEGQR